MLSLLSDFVDIATDRRLRCFFLKYHLLNEILNSLSSHKVSSDVEIHCTFGGTHLNVTLL